jgi:hypothetical protein
MPFLVPRRDAVESHHRLNRPHVTDDVSVNFRHAGIRVAEVEPLHHQAPAEARAIAHRAGDLEGRLALVLLHQLGRDGQLRPGPDEVGVLDVLGFFQLDDAVGVILAESQQPGRGLRRRFEHENARQHRELGEVVLEVLFAITDLLRAHQALVGDVLIDRVEQPKPHRKSLARTGGERCDTAGQSREYGQDG